MEVSCDLQVDVNGEEVFVVDKKTLSSYCGKIRNLFSISKGVTRNLKVIFHDFPGGAEGFELTTRFCYNNGKIDINPLNVSLLCCVSHYMEMSNLAEETEKSLEEVKYWTWGETLVALKQCQDLFPVSSSCGVLRKCVDSIVGRIVLGSETSPCPSSSSPESSGFRLSSDTRSTESLKNNFFRATWWFEELVALNPCLVEIVVKSMLYRKLDQAIISRFLFYYQKSKFVTATSDEKRIIIEIVIEMLFSLDQSVVSCKSLYGILRVALNMSISKRCRNKLESMIGLQLDQASLDNLLIPSPIGSKYLYDVDLIVRFLKSFFLDGICRVELDRLKKVAILIESYIAEVAPDPSLKPSKFLALVKALPDSAMESYDKIYKAVDIYLQVHSGLSEEEKMSVCSGLNYKKLSSEVCNHIAQNRKFPTKSAVQALTFQQCKLKSLLHETNNLKSFINSPCSSTETQSTGEKDDTCEQIVVYAGKLDISAENAMLKENLQGMQCRVMELEKACKKMQNQMGKIMKSRLSSHSNARSLPRLCS